jgi:hypothetical protein
MFNAFSSQFSIHRIHDNVMPVSSASVSQMQGGSIVGPQPPLQLQQQQQHQQQQQQHQLQQHQLQQQQLQQQQLQQQPAAIEQKWGGQPSAMPPCPSRFLM